MLRGDDEEDVVAYLRLHHIVGIVLVAHPGVVSVHEGVCGRHRPIRPENPLKGHKTHYDIRGKVLYLHLEELQDLPEETQTREVKPHS